MFWIIVRFAFINQIELEKISKIDSMINFWLYHSCCKNLYDYIIFSWRNIIFMFLNILCTCNTQLCFSLNHFCICSNIYFNFYNWFWYLLIPAWGIFIFLCKLKFLNDYTLKNPMDLNSKIVLIIYLYLSSDSIYLSTYYYLNTHELNI